MHTPPGGFGVPSDVTFQRLYARLRKISTLARWQDQSTRTIADLRAELHVARTLIAAHQQLSGRALYPPPDELVTALRGGSARVNVVIDDQPVVIGLTPEIRRPDPLAEALAWQDLIDVHRTVRAEWTVPDAVGFRLASLPVGHRYQAWRTAGSDIVVVARSLPTRLARVTVRTALRALHMQVLALPLLWCVVG